MATVQRLITAVVALLMVAGAACADAREDMAQQVLQNWYRLTLELVRHTPTYTPPVAARTFGYLGVGAYEAVASGTPAMTTLAGQLNGLTTTPPRAAGAYDDAVILQAEMSASVHALFFNTGPTGQRAMAALETQMAAKAADGVDPDTVTRSQAYGAAVAAHILDWAATDGGAQIDNLGFPRSYALNPEPGHWMPTSKIVLQQAPLLPEWGKNRPFAMPSGGTCPLPPPPEYSTDPASEYAKQAREVYDISKSLTEDQAAIARFWSDDAMLSNTPPGHWIAVLVQVTGDRNLPLPARLNVMARIGIVVADSFITSWHGKYAYERMRPVTYIKANIDPKWESLLTTPPFPEYPSGHSVQSGAAATVLTQLFGDNFAYEDDTNLDGLPPRQFASFWAAAHEADISRLYGGIHYRAAVENGIEQGKCVGEFTNALKTLE